MRSAGFALERSAIIVTGSTMTTLPPCSICTLAWPSAVMVMAPPGASTLVVEGSCAYPTDPARTTTQNATVHRSFIRPPFAATRRDYTPRSPARIAHTIDDGGSPMTVGARRVFACAAVVCAACLVDAAGLRAQTAPERVPMVEETFKTVQSLRGIPVDTFFQVMGTFASSMGNACTLCHPPH